MRGKNNKKLNKRVELLEQESIDNNAGGKFTNSIKWIPYAKAWANIEFVRGNESYNNYQLQSELTHLITIRYRKDITIDNRLRLNDRVFKIMYIQNVDESNTYLILHVTEDV